ncbi:hypothetical protein V2J09_013946 [Rumex salicifolius]
MEASRVLNSKSVVISELIQGRELAKQLQNHLDPSTPHETREFLIQKILSTYHKLLHMTNPPCKDSFPMDPNSYQISFHGGIAPESPCSASPSSDLDNSGHSSKRRKTLPKWVKTVKVSSEEGEEVNLSDGYSWRKYGQKAILGTKHPRGYYRCTHRHTRGCDAIKQVQKSSEDPTLFHVIYKGHHTCSSHRINQHSTNANPPPLLSGPHEPLKPEPESAHPSPHREIQDHKTPRSVSPQLKVDMDDIFSAFLGEFVSVSPATSDSSHFLGGNRGSNDMWTSESDVNHEHGGSGLETPFGGFEFTLDEFGIKPNFPFYEPEFMFG